MTADNRIDLTHRFDIGQRLHQRRRKRCCVGAVVADVLEPLPLVADIFEPKTQQAVRGLGYGISYLKSVADCERRHKRSKHFICKGVSSFAGFATKTYLEDWRLHAVRNAARETETLAALKDALPESAQHTDHARNAAASKRTKQKSGYDCFVTEKKEEEKAGGGSAKQLCFSTTGRKRLSSEWLATPPQEKMAYKMQAKQETSQNQLAVRPSRCQASTAQWAPTAALVGPSDISEGAIVAWSEPDVRKLLIVPGALD